MTITEKILAAHAGREEVRSGEVVDCALDMMMAGGLMKYVAKKKGLKPR